MKEELTASEFGLRPTKWIVTIPKGGDLVIHYKDDINLWARMVMRFLGWGVRKPVKP